MKFMLDFLDVQANMHYAIISRLSARWKKMK